MRRGVVAAAVMALILVLPAMPVLADGGGHGGRTVELRDRCDPVTFDAAIGPGTCAPHDGELVTFGTFLQFLNPVDFGHPKWLIKPEHAKIKAGDRLNVIVRGGEFHTFTEVAAFGPGCVPFINDALGLAGAPAVADCNAAFAATGVGPGGTLSVTGLAPGTHLFICLIHPWMRSTIEVRAGSDD